MPTDLEFEVKYALSTAYLCPANVFGRKPSSGSNVYSRAVMSLDVVMKHLWGSKCQCAQSNELSHNELGVWRPHYAEYFIMMTCIRPVQVERRKFAD